MTDLLETLFDVEEVKINPIIAALTIPHNPRMEREVRRFGFEYEMFPQGYEMQTHHCNCDYCEETGDSLAQWALDAGLINDPDQHSYHCDCDDCEYTRSGPLLTAQSDCSCGIEFVSRIIDLDHFDQAERDIRAWVQIMRNWKNSGYWMPNGSTHNGNHVHVSNAGDNWGFSHTQRELAESHMNTLYSVFEWVDVADGGCGRLRGYNTKPSDGSGGAWLRMSDCDTFEHRLWNTPRDPERLWAHLGISIGLTRWAFALAVGMPTFTFTTRVEDRCYGGYKSSITEQTFEMLHLRLGDIINGIMSYIPREPCFDIARDLILNLS